MSRATPAAVEDDEFAGGHMVLPDAQAGAVHGGVQLLPRVIRDAFETLVLQQQPVVSLP
jgi:hypothetical protein